MSKWKDGIVASFAAAKERRQRREWDGNCHGCQLPIHQEQVATIGPYWICDECIKSHFPNREYSENQIQEIIQAIRSPQGA